MLPVAVRVAALEGMQGMFVALDDEGTSQNSLQCCLLSGHSIGQERVKPCSYIPVGVW
jgi:hypothetical protein